MLLFGILHPISRTGPMAKRSLLMNQLRIRENGEVVIADILTAKILDEGEINELGREFSNLTLEAAVGRKLLVNFQYVRLMSSSMISQIVRLNNSCEADKIKLKLCNIAPEIFDAFKITKLNKIITICDDEQSAIEAFGS
jgi:anti-anti-sigma factor